MTESKPLNERTCQYCNHAGPHVIEVRTAGVHYADVRCIGCRSHLGFLSKPVDDPTKYKRQAAHRDLVAKYGRGFCEMCLTLESELPKGRTLEGQHVIEYADGGNETRENIWILCTGCHKLVHWLRTYNGGDCSRVLETLATALKRRTV